jgi:hypothetical protein
MRDRRLEQAFEDAAFCENPPCLDVWQVKDVRGENGESDAEAPIGPIG